jgi:hypothetical protein
MLKKRDFVWGQRLRNLIKIAISFKDELIILAGVIATVFVVSKISAGVVATIAAINALIKAYNALKASAIVAGVATAFALNPLLGVGAVALAAGVLAGANALAGRSNIGEVSLPSVSSAGFSGTMPNGQRFSTTVATPGSTVVPPIPTPNLGGVSNTAGGGVSTAAASAARAAASTSPYAFGTSGVNTNTLAGIMAASGQPSVVINVNSPSIIDEEGFTRALNNAQNNSFFRGTGGATNLVGI